MFKVRKCDGLLFPCVLHALSLTNCDISSKLKLLVSTRLALCTVNAGIIVVAEQATVKQPGRSGPAPSLLPFLDASLEFDALLLPVEIGVVVPSSLMWSR